MKPNLKKWEVSYSLITPSDEYPRTSQPTAKTADEAERMITKEFYDPSGQTRIIIHAVKEIVL